MTVPTALLRVARRALLRDRWRALLVVILIGLPVMGITTAALLLRTALPTPAERATARMGMADLEVTPLGSHGPAELLPLLPQGSAIEAIWVEGDRAVVGGVNQVVDGRYVDLDGLAAGMLLLLDGRLPSAPDEIAVSVALARGTGVGIGGVLELERAGPQRVVGIVEDPRSLGRLLFVGDPSLATTADRVPRWLVALPAGVPEEVVATDVAAAFDPAIEGWRQPRFDVLTRARAGQASETFVTLVVLLGSLALVESALVAAAAFAVGIRRRQRELGLLGAAGATPRQLAVSVLAEGLVAGVVAVAAGIGLGLAVAAMIATRLDDLTGARAGALELDPVILVLAALVGLVAALVASAIPAWGASRLPTSVALSGRRPPSTPARRLLLVGLGLVLLAFGFTVGAPLMGRGGGDTLALALLVVGAVTGVVGFGACSPWLLERLEAAARHLPLSPRVALRDTARARTRNGPIVTAVLASVAATIALAAVLASQEAQNARWWRPSVASDSLMVHGSEAAGARIARELGAVGHGADRDAAGPDYAWTYELVMPLREPRPAEDITDLTAGIVVGDERLLLAYHGDAALDAFRAGTTVVLESDPDDPLLAITGSSGTLRRIDMDPDGDSRSTELSSIPVVRVPGRRDTPRSTFAVMPSATAESLGLDIDTTGEVQYLVRLDHDVTAADVDRAAAVATTVDPDAAIDSPLRPPDPMLGFRLLTLVAALVAALTVTGIAVALGETEARADQRTLLALGAARGLRRRITASRALVVAALAGILAVPAGLLPVWGVLTSLDWPVVVPLPEVLGALVVLPLAAVAGGSLLGRPLPEWAARRDLET